MDLVRIKGYEDYYAINKAGQIYSFRRGFVEGRNLLPMVIDGGMRKTRNI